MEDREIENIENKKKDSLFFQRGIFLCKIYLVLSAILVPLWMGFTVYLLMYGYNKDGEYCYYTKSLDNYHILVNGIPCLLQWRMAGDFLLFSSVWLIPIQAPVWLLFLYFKRRERRRLQGKEAIHEIP